MAARGFGFGRQTVPVFIPAFNNPTYLRQIVASLRRFPALSVTVLDNASTYPPMLALYRALGADVDVRRGRANVGPRAVWEEDALFASLPQYFCLTDPDLALNPDLPDDFVETLARVTDSYQFGKAGFALDLSDRHLMVQAPFRHDSGHHRIWEHEARHWEVPLEDPTFEDPLYLATVDTTFALYNKAFFDRRAPFEAIRVAGRFTARHLPWYVDNGLPAEEERCYRAGAEYSYFLGDRPAVQVRSLYARQDAALGIGN